MLQGKTYDAVILGTSWGDRLLPMAFAQAGRNVALVERGYLGGTCVNTGCTPTKTMVASARDRVVPYTVFIDPQLGRVGMSEEEARRQGRNVRVAKQPMKNVARALETGETRGFMKAVVDAETGQILGCAILGLEGGEIMTIWMMVMMGKVPYTTLRDGIFTHPALAEGLNSLFMTLGS